MKTTQEETIRVTCPKCRGRGRIAEYNHVSAGVCFRCEGYGYELRSVRSKAKAVRDAVKEAKEAAEEAARVAALPATDDAGRPWFLAAMLGE
jgi:DnaJ-class molecular chaperone